MGTNLGRCGQCFAYPIYEIENSRRTLPINAGFEDGEREPAVKKCVWPPEAGKGNKKDSSLEPLKKTIGMSIT